MKVTNEMLEVAEAVRPKLIEDGMFLVGLDIVGLAPRSSGDTRYLRNFCWAAGSTLTPVIATLNQTPLPYPAPASYYFFFEAAIYGASFVDGTATIYHEDGTNMDPFVPLNVMAPYRASCAPPNQ